MEQWKQILSDAYNLKSDVTLLGADVTGVKGSQDAPDGVFFSEFPEEDAMAYGTIFSNFVSSYRLNPKFARSGLEDDLNIQNKAVDGRFCPLELILYSSRLANGIIEQDADVFGILKRLVGNLMIGNGDIGKIAHYILGGWEWKPQIAIFIEAIGSADNSLIGMAMDYYPQIAELCIDDNTNLIKSYLKMLIDSQDVENVEFVADVVSHAVFKNDYELIEYLYNTVIKNRYWKNPEVLRRLVEAIESRNISMQLRAKMSDIRKRHIRDDEPSFVLSSPVPSGE